jgi:hypothetical protein
MPRTHPPAKAGPKTSKATKKTTTRRAKPQPKSFELSPELRHEMIKAAAYYRAEKRGFQGGDPIADWLLSEQEIDSALSAGAH